MKLVFFPSCYPQNVQRDRVYGYVEILRTNAYPVAIGSKPNGALQFDTCHGGRSAWAGCMPERGNYPVYSFLFILSNSAILEALTF